MHSIKMRGFFVWFVCALLSSVCYAQEIPPIVIYSPDVYGADNQNWSITQSSENYIYVANNKGLLEFNGSKWELYPSPNEDIIRSVNVIDDRIYTGSYREFGYWQKNEFGKLVYQSLSKELGISFLDEEEFWNIIAFEDWILFQSLNRIYICNKNTASYSIIDSETVIYKMFKVNEGIYFQKTKDGIYKIEGGESKLISDDPVIKDNLLVNIYDLEGQLLIQTENAGFYIMDNVSLKKWEISANDILDTVSVYRSIQLKDKSFVLGTISNGVLHLTTDGNVSYDINNSNGLSNNTIHSIFEDDENNIWLGLENGINCVNIKSPFSIYTDDKGKIGTVRASAVFNNNLYLGTNQGLYYKPLDSDDEFRFIKGTQGVVWCLVIYDNTLFCGHNLGTFVVNDDSAKLNIDVQGTWNIIPIHDNKNILLQGNYDGLNVIEKKGDEWKFRNKIEGYDISSKYFEIMGPDEVFVSHENKGVIKVKVDKQFTKAIAVERDSSVEKGLSSSLIKYKGDILYTYKAGVFKYSPEDRAFHKDSVLSTIFSKESYVTGKLIVDPENDILWGFSAKNLNYISPGHLTSTPKINRISFSEALPRGLTGYENITHLRDQKHLLGTASGYIIIDLNKINGKPFNISINSITKHVLDESPEYVSKANNGIFDNKYNNVEFNFSVPEFEKYLDTEYQYQLVGIYNNWTDWSSNATALFKNLPFGIYTFNARAKIGNKLTENVASYTFEIKRPWLLSNVAIIIYVLLILFFSFLLHNAYKTYYRKQGEKILEKTNRELELKELENQQQLMRFNNEKLRQDIENKNRELAISTMSLIKKNEFLNTIKKELKSAGQGRDLKQVVRIIDSNLNNTDDWYVFEEAFNNADKDFLRKIKQEHPALTHNDLRLCAYLRLNLTSKEIAPLLNISSRSVEVKRYRLRKKMNLAHETSLTDYILKV